MHLGTIAAAILLSLVGVAPASAAPPIPSLQAQAVVARNFINSVGDAVPYRVGYVGGGGGGGGGAGFGHSKVIARHKIANDGIVGAVVRAP